MSELQEIRRQIAELEKRADEIARAQRSAVIQEIRAKMLENGLTVEDLIEKKSKAAKSTATVVYRSEDGQTWAGRGRQPFWVRQKLEAGEDIEKYRV